MDLLPWPIISRHIVHPTSGPMAALLSQIESGGSSGAVPSGTRFVFRFPGTYVPGFLMPPRCGWSIVAPLFLIARFYSFLSLDLNLRRRLKWKSTDI